MTSTWLGTPCGGSSADAYTCFVGGNAVWLRQPKGDASGAKCPRCGKDDTTMSLAQLFVPLGSFDRTLYLFYCRQCTKETPYVFALRCQNYIGQAEPEKKVAAKEPEAASGPMFAEDDDWGDSGDDIEVSQTAAMPVVSDEAEEEPEETTPAPVYEAAGDLLHENVAASRCQSYPMHLLEVFEEVMAEADFGTLEEQLMAAEAKCPGTGEIDMTGEEEDDETPEQLLERDFMDRLAQEPRQCVRWHPGGDPLLAKAVRASVPACPGCGAARHFECQLMAPVIYYLTKRLGEASNALQFSTVLVFTCSANCYSQSQPYHVEETVVQGEL